MDPQKNSHFVLPIRDYMLIFARDYNEVRVRLRRGKVGIILNMRFAIPLTIMPLHLPSSIFALVAAHSRRAVAILRWIPPPSPIAPNRA